MMKRTKKLTALLLAGVLAVGVAAPATKAQAASTDMKLVINDESIYSDATIGQPYITDSGRTMMPLRIVGETLQCDVVYTNGNVYIENERNHYSAIFESGADYFYANGKRIALDTPMVTSAEGRTYVPARAFIETLGNIDWDNSTRTVAITTNDWILNDDPYYAKQIDIEGTGLTFNLERGGNQATWNNLYVTKTDTVQNIGAYLRAPEEIASWFTPENMNAIDLHKAKMIDGNAYLGISMTFSPSNSFTMNVVRTPDIATDESGQMTYIGTISRTSDYTLDDNYLYFTEGLYQGPYQIDPNKLYISKIGDQSARVSVDVDFAINTCSLNVENGNLIAIDLDGTRHELNIQKLLAEAE